MVFQFQLDQLENIIFQNNFLQIVEKNHNFEIQEYSGSVSKYYGNDSW